MSNRQFGTVKWFNDEKASASSPQEGPDLFVHYRSIESAGFKSLAEGQQVSYLVAKGPKGLQAEQVQVV